jgi:hypothetical protein
MLPRELQGEAKKAAFVLEDSTYDLSIFLERRLTVRALNVSKDLNDAINKLLPKILLVTVYTV